MDDRIHDHAGVLVDWSARIEEGDNVVVSVAEGAHDLAVAVARALGDRGANPVLTYASAEVNRANLRAHDDDFDENPAHERALYENADVVLSLGGGRNTSALADVPGEKRQAAAKASEGIRDVRRNTDRISTVHPTRSLAQQAGMSDEAYQDFVYDAVLRDWESLAEEMAGMKELLDDGSEVRIVTQETDITMSVENRTAVNSTASVVDDSHNLPSGEVFTAPHATEGEILFDIPMTLRGKRVRNVSLQFEDGEVVDYDAAQNSELIGDILDTDDGARRLGELGIGMNRGIDRPTDNILFDEKMAGTVHLALGRAYDTCLPDGEDGNDSAVHVDLITDMSENSRLEIDGEAIQRDGVFRWEDGFE